VTTEILLPPDLKEKIEREADARGMSLSDFVCKSLEWLIAQQSAEDPLFADTAVHRDDGPDDVSSKHDDYLYGDAS